MEGVSHMTSPRFFLGILIIIFGLSLLMGVSLFRYILPLFLIWIGWRIISGQGELAAAVQSSSTEDYLKQVLIFSGITKKLMSKNLEGGEVVAIFGAADIDLRDVKTKAENVTLDVVAIFGGIKLIVPKDWSVKTDGVGIIGGFDNRTQHEGKTVTQLTIKGTAIFGGVEVVD